MRQMLQHKAAEPADRAFLDRDQHLVLARQPLDQLGVERLGEARVGDGGRQPARRQLVRRLQAFLPGARRSSGSRSLVPSRRMRPRPISQRHALLRQRDADARRRADSAAPMGRSSIATRGRHHVHELGLVGRRHHARSPAGSRDRPTSNEPAWVWPSAPTSPARSIAKRTGSFWIATSCTTWS